MNPKFLSVLRCPEANCSGTLEFAERTTEYNGRVIDGVLACRDCGGRYRVRDGFPVLLADSIDDGSDLGDV